MRDLSRPAVIHFSDDVVPSRAFETLEGALRYWIADVSEAMRGTAWVEVDGALIDLPEIGALVARLGLA